MPFVTRLTFESGDGDLLTDVVEEIKASAERKGVELKGPHPKPPTHRRVPQYKHLAGDGTFDAWRYTVYTREIEIVDHNEFARDTAGQEYPDSIHLSVDVEQFSQTGSG